MKRSIIGLLSIVILIAAASCDAHSAYSGKAAQTSSLKPTNAFALIQKNKGNPEFVILDVRTPEEFRSGHLPGAINIGIQADTFKDDMNKLDRSKTYLVYCRTGRRTNQALDIMQELGFTHLLRIDGDITKWKAEKLPLVK